MVTQEPYLFHGTIRDNIAYARPDATAAEIEQAARDANIHDRILGSPRDTRPSPASAATGSPAARSSGSPSPGCC